MPKPKIAGALALLAFPFFVSGCRNQIDAEETRGRELQKSASEVRFLAWGDWGMGNSAQKKVAGAMVNYCKFARCDFAIGLGDNFYPAGVKSVSDPYWEDRFEKIYGPLNLVLYPSLGNHDYGGNVQAQIDYSKINPHWQMPSRYFSFTRQFVEFYAIDTNDFSVAQAKWLEDGLRASPAQWKIVYGHHPIYSYGAHGDTPTLKKNLLPILKNLANFYIAGHDHDQQVLKPDGDLHFILSGAAAENRGFKAGPKPKAVWLSGELGFSHLTATNEKVTFRAVNAEGEVKFEYAFEASVAGH